MKTGPLGRVPFLIRHGAMAGPLRRAEQAGRDLPGAGPIHGFRRGVCRIGYG
jgi:hypothetical protein